MPNQGTKSVFRLNSVSEGHFWPFFRSNFFSVSISYPGPNTVLMVEIGLSCRAFAVFFTCPFQSGSCVSVPVSQFPVKVPMFVSHIKNVSENEPIAVNLLEVRPIHAPVGIVPFAAINSSFFTGESALDEYLRTQCRRDRCCS